MKKFIFSIPVIIVEEDSKQYYSVERNVNITISADSLNDSIDRFTNNFSKALKAFND